MVGGVLKLGGDVDIISYFVFKLVAVTCMYSMFNNSISRRRFYVFFSTNYYI